jgi:AcrR family transcriptional regulator
VDNVAMIPNTIENTTVLVNDIINCAGKFFKKYGYKKTTVDEIAGELGISKRTLYGLFSSKMEILREVAWRDTMKAMQVFTADLPAGIPSDKALISFCRFIFSDRIKQGTNGNFRGLYNSDPDIRDAYRSALKRIVNILYEEGMKNGLFKPVETAFATEVITVLITAATDHFHREKNSLHVFNSALSMIVDAVAFKNRIPFEGMG